MASSLSRTPGGNQKFAGCHPFKEWAKERAAIELVIWSTKILPCFFMDPKHRAMQTRQLSKELSMSPVAWCSRLWGPQQLWRAVEDSNCRVRAWQLLSWAHYPALANLGSSGYGLAHERLGHDLESWCPWLEAFRRWLAFGWRQNQERSLSSNLSFTDKQCLGNQLQNYVHLTKPSFLILPAILPHLPNQGVIISHVSFQDVSEVYWDCHAARKMIGYSWVLFLENVFKKRPEVEHLCLGDTVVSRWIWDVQLLIYHLVHKSSGSSIAIHLQNCTCEKPSSWLCETWMSRSFHFSGLPARGGLFLFAGRDVHVHTRHNDSEDVKQNIRMVGFWNWLWWCSFILLSGLLLFIAYLDYVKECSI